MQKKIWLANGCLAGLIVLFSSCQNPSSVEDMVCFQKTCFIIEVANDEESRIRGLQDRRQMQPRHGMLFIFLHSQRHSFWMKNTYIPLDMIWMDYARKIVHIEKNVPPCPKDPCPTYTPAKEALYVLELNAGMAQANALQLGQTADFKINP